MATAIPAALAEAARYYLDNLIVRRQARLRVYDVDGDLWVAHIEWDDGDPVHPVIGYTGAGRSQDAAVVNLAKIVQDDRENVR